MHRRKVICLLIAFVLSVTALSGCTGGNDGDGDGKQASGSGGSKEPQKTVTLASEDGKFQLTAPDDWEVSSETLNSDSDLEIAKKNQEAFAIVLAEAKENFDFDLKKYQSLIIENMTNPNSIKNAETTSPASITIGGNQAILSEIVGAAEGINIHYWVYCVENDQYFVQLIGWTLKGDEEKYGPEIKKVLESFQFK